MALAWLKEFFKMMAPKCLLIEMIEERKNTDSAKITAGEVYCTCQNCPNNSAVPAILEWGKDIVRFSAKGGENEQLYK